MEEKNENYNKFIVISGTPGTGKTALSKKLSLLFKKDLVNITDFCKKEGLFTDWDHNANTYDVDIQEMSSKLLILAEKAHDIMIIDGHMAHFLPKSTVKTCIICTTDIKILKKRLMQRNYSEKKIKENIDSEIFEICRIESEEIGHKTVKIDCTTDIDTVISKNMAIFKEIFEN